MYTALHHNYLGTLSKSVAFKDSTQSDNIECVKGIPEKRILIAELGDMNQQPLESWYPDIKFAKTVMEDAFTT